MIRNRAIASCDLTHQDHHEPDLSRGGREVQVANRLHPASGVKDVAPFEEVEGRLA